MENTIFPAHAKLNLSLNLLPRRGLRNYYTVRFINAQLDLHDLVAIEVNGRGGRVTIETSGEDPGPENIAARAAEILLRRYHIDRSVRISIDKRIPVRAGLGGGSSDAAAVINGLTAMLGLPLSPVQKNRIAQELGMDVCYCVTGGLCRIGGVGEIVERLPLDPPSLEVLLAVPEETKPSTAWAYSIVDDGAIGRELTRMDALFEGLKRRDPALVASGLHNDFEAPVGRVYPVVGRIKETLLSYGAAGALLAGSGLTVFGIFTDRHRRQAARAELEGRGIGCIETVTVP
jgi:4-diphosphocytidyl-2-C-methyl-D-erythritol kinase